MSVRISFGGPAQYQLRSALEMGQSVLEVLLRRTLKGPRRPGWNWLMELGTQVLRRHLVTAFKMRDVIDTRRYLDSVVISSQVLAEVNITRVVQNKFSGAWFSSKRADTPLTILYLHGGGYSFYPRSYIHFIALITRTATSRTFALDYRLSPEHRFPSQLEDALHAYRWLLENGTDPDNLVVAGDSAGGHLALSLLLAARDSKLSLPALAIAISPPTDFEHEYASMASNQAFDWIDGRMLKQWADWFCDPSQRGDPLLSPMLADLRGLPPIYVQAGRAEILYDSIQAFADRARSQGANVMLETWADMNHDFQVFGPYVPQSAEALQRIREVIDAGVRGRKKTASVSTVDV